MNCPVGRICGVEESHSGAQSPGIVQDDERLVRAAIDPIHFNPKSGQVKVAFIRQDDIAQGNLSVWRMEQLPAQQGDALLNFFEERSRPEHTIASVYAPPASAIRRLSLPETGRGFSVLDDTKTGPNEDDINPAHAAITLCQHKRDHGQDAIKLKFAREALKNLFLSHPV